MVIKRILSCLAIFLIIFILSCYDVKYDDDDDSSGGNWYDGLSTKQMVEGMEIIAKAANSKSTASEIEVSWVFPTYITKWAVKYRIDSYDGNEDVDWSEPDITITNKEVQENSYKQYKYFFGHKITFKTTQYIVYYKISMTDTNGEEYENIVSFLVYPDARTLRVTYAASESSVDCSVYGAWISTCIFNIIKTAAGSSDLPGDYAEFTLSAYSPVFFWIDSDFASKGLDTVTHYSNSSYCKVTRLASPSTIAGKTVEATLKYSFEDLPQDMLKYEDGKAFDYDDMVFYVDIIK